MLFEAVVKSQPREPIYVIKKKTHQRFTLEKLKETSSLVRKAECWSTRLYRLPCVQSLRGRDVLGAHYACAESGKLQRDVAGNVVTKGQLAVYLLYTQPGCGSNSVS